MSTVIRRALYGKMAGDSTLTNLLATPPTGFSKPIFHELAPQEAAFPYVIFSKSAGTPIYTFKVGHAAIDNEVWLIKGVARSADADPVDAIASRLDALLTDGVLSISGFAQMYLRRESDVEYLEEPDYRHAGALYRLLYQT